ncbi:MAG: BtrH N-terminal domain-containing protein [Gemmatimonadota bacterium]
MTAGPGEVPFEGGVMRYTVPGYAHRRGEHCGSGAMRNLLAFRGILLSEPMCFGLGSGAGFLYLPAYPVPPRVAFHGRIMELERALCGVLGIPFPERPEPDGDAGWARAREAVLAGNPVLVNTDLAFLDYFDTKTHFSGHRVVLIGFDDEAGEAHLSDSEWDAPQAVPIASLSRSRSSDVPPYPMENRWCVVAPDGPLRPIAEAVPAALRKNAGEMLSAPEAGVSGVAGMRRAARELPGWPDMTPEWAFAARFGYQVIEKRGTGGGFFRRLYARYLEEASAVCPPVADAGLPRAMVGVADGWTGIAALLKEISESKDRGAFRRAGEMLLRQADAEETFWRTAARAATSCS